MAYELQIKSTYILQNLTDILRNRMSPYLNSEIRINQYYRGDKVPYLDRVEYPYFISESLCLILPRYITSQKNIMIYSALAENYIDKIMQYYINLCEQNLRPKDINVLKLEEVQKSMRSTPIRIYAMTTNPALIHPSIDARQLPDKVVSNSHIFTTNQSRHNTQLRISYTPTTYEETAEPHMVAVKSTLTFELVPNFENAEYTRVLIN